MERGGAELRTVELAESFGGERVRSDFLVLSGLDGALDHRVRRAGGSVIKCPLNLRFPASFCRLLKAERYDVVHSHVHYFSGVILAMARLAGTPGRIAHFRTSVVNDKPDTPQRRAQLALCRRLVDLNATDILAVGEGAMRGAWSVNWRADPRCRVVYNGLAAGLPSPRPRTGPRRPTIVNVASIQPLKNQVRLIGILGRCLSRVPALQLLLVGREVDSYGQTVRRAVEGSGMAEHVRFVGEVDDPLSWIAGADLMMLPSLWEGMPGAALEACALGVPVLASDLPGSRELARYFPHLKVMDLGEDDETWASAAVHLIESGGGLAMDPAACLARSPFNLDRSRETYYEIWSRARAYA
jgi:glycosyltransferase involved in cell wall biosynthesis